MIDDYKRRHFATIFQECCVLIIVDCADQSEFELPQLITSSNDQFSHALRLNLIGILEHKHERHSNLFNVTIVQETVSNHIEKVLHRSHNERAFFSSLLPKLYIRVENCTRKELAYTFITTIVWYPQTWCQRSSILLAVGFIHEDVNQAFDKTSKYLRHNNAISLNVIHVRLLKSISNNSSFNHLRVIANWSAQCQKEKSIMKMKSFSHFKYFRISISSGKSRIVELVSPSYKVKVNVWK